MPRIDIHKPIPPSGGAVLELFKFSSLDGDRLEWFEAMVVRREFYFAHPYELNDPFECRPRFMSPEQGTSATFEFKLRAFLRAYGVSTEEIKRAPRRPVAEVTRLMRERYRSSDGEQRNVQLFCMTTTRAHPLLWAHYANGHRGACVHLDHGYIPFPTALKVHYEADYPAIPLLADLAAEEIYRRVVCVKGLEWEYEGEYRVIRHLRSEMANMDMEWKGQVACASPNAVSGVTLGARISAQHQDAILNMVRRRSRAIPVGVTTHLTRTLGNIPP